MSKTKGSKNYFQNGTLYFLKDVIGYIRKFEPALDIPQSWEHGGGLNDLARKFEIVPDFDNGIKGKGHFTKYKYTTMYKFARLVIDYLKNTTPKKPRLTPIEVANKEAKKQEELAPVIVLDPIPEQLEVRPNNGEGIEEIKSPVVPVGFIEVNGKKGERILFRAADVFEVCDWSDDDVDGVPTHLVISRENTQMSLMIANSYDEVITKLRKTQTPQVEINKDGSLTLWNSPEV